MSLSHVSLCIGKDGEGAVGKAQSHGEEEAGEGVLSKIDFSGK